MRMKPALELLKLRIGVTIAATAATGYAAMVEKVDPLSMALLVLAMLLGSGGSAVFNHLYDRDIDAVMKRTRNRPLVVGSISNTDALMLSAGLTIAGLSTAVMTLNWVVAAHLFLGIFVYAIVYTVWLKRRTWWNIVFGGAAGSFALLAGAALGEPAQWLLPTLLAITLFLWTPSHFWALAILLADDYRAAGVPMLPVVVGEKRTSLWILANSVALVGSSLLPWGLGLLGPLYGWGAVGLGAVLLGLNLKLVASPSRRWAGWNFAWSIPYLLGLLCIIALDKHWS
ncbi:heme o synthase [Magnetospirillum sp. 64-120]|uniref:heme o synthase n=1 Tax=Magnetospirillum sp. 64-120 TaxID=1895778 RepID=UPI00092AD76F|nr:heme o synthase [Magnetospirillum sp. 64-120]OJX70905.1 MAG: protoheme IX farnesyltransferase [Magnetospirillum sp. 64-120]